MKDPAYTQRYYNKRPHFLFQRSNSMWKEEHGKPRVKSTKNSELILRKCGFCINCLNWLPILPDKVALCPWKPCCRTGPHCLRSMMYIDRQKNFLLSRLCKRSCLLKNPEVYSTPSKHYPGNVDALQKSHKTAMLSHALFCGLRCRGYASARGHMAYHNIE